MGLKQSVVIVNEFTVKTPNGGTRGGTPGDYVRRYMARDGATEDLTPVRRDTENFVMRYMARKEAVDVADSVADLKDNMRDIQGDGGIAFGYGEVSLSHKKLKKASKDIQKHFDEGKTVLKTVLSFDEDYLRQYGIVQPDFEFQNEGDYRGNIDQMKLRLAVMNGMDKLSRHYDDLQYVGVIQVDTKHVHCHLAMVDRGKGTLMPDGTQRGKLTDKEKQDIRRGIDLYLDEAQPVKMMAANVDHDKRNTLCYIKKFTHKAMDNRGFGQFLLACLPKDRSLWRAGTNRKEMQKPNAIVREYVTELLKQPNSGYSEAMQKVGRYAQSRMDNEDLTGREYRKLVSDGHRRIVEEGMNCVYSVLKQVPDEEMRLRTPMLEIMAAPYEDIASETEDDPIIEFGFKLRSYKTRLDHHKKERHKYHDAAQDYKQRESRGETSEESKPLLDFLEEEEEYNAMLMAKYQYFLNFIPPDEEYQQDFDELMEYDERVTNLSRMRRDSSMTKMKADNAERYGRKVYGVEGGSYMVNMPQVLDTRLAAMRTKYDEMRDAYKVKLADYGMVLDDENNVKKESPYDFDDVKALDIHHLAYDFPYDFKISMRNVDQFVEAADRRYEKFQKAKEYLVGSGQEEALEAFPVADIELQKSTADRFREDATLYTQRNLTPETRKATRTVTLDYDFYNQREEEIKNIIKTTINDLQYE